MRKLIMSGIVLGISTLTTAAWAGPLDARTQLVLPSLDSRVAVSDVTEDTTTPSAVLAPSLYAPTALTPTLHGTWNQDDTFPTYLPTPGPEGLSLNVRVNQFFSLYVSADLDAKAPRPDAIHGETYFSVGASFDLTHQLQFFVEDFQPASAIVGDELREPAPLYFWDGHQITAGLSYNQDAWSLQAGAVLYTLSTSNRDAGVGARVSLTFRF